MDSTYKIPPGCICLGDGMLGMKCEAPTHAVEVEFYRASGDMLCVTCGKTYYDHPLDQEIRDYNNEPFLHRICNGDLVKL